LRDNFYCGNFPRVLELAEQIEGNDFGEKLDLVSRSHLCQGQLDKIKGLQNSTVPGQQATAFKTVVQRSQDGSKKQQALERLTALAKQSRDPNAMALASAALAEQDDFAGALELIKDSRSPELLAQRVQYFIMINRVDLAEKQLMELKSVAGDCTIVNMAVCMVLIATGNHQEAYLTYTDLADQFAPNEDDPTQASALLLLGKGVANMQRNLWEEALSDLAKSARADAGRAETLVNTICCNARMSDEDAFSTNVKQFKDAFASHPMSMKLEECNAAFTRFNAAR